MLGEILATISAGISIINGLTTLYRNMQGESPVSGPVKSIQTVQTKVINVEKKLSRPQQNEKSLLNAYSSLIKSLQKDEFYSSRIEIIPTEYGTWKIIRKRTKKNTILRDPKGEFYIE